MIDLLSASPIARVLGYALVEFLWQGVAIGVATWALLVAARHATANARYLIASLGLATMAAAPIATVALDAGQPAAISAGVIRSQSIETAETPAVTGSVRPGIFSAAWLEPRLPIVLLAWSAGVMLLAIHLIVGWLRLGRLQRRARVLADRRWTARVSEMAQQLGVTSRWRLLESTIVEMPSVIGWIRPAILLPASALACLPPAHLEAILAHELAHIRRRDYLVNLLQCVVETLLFYQPAVWWVSRQMRLEREHCCDDAAASLCADRVTYAAALTSLEELRAATPAFAVGAGGGDLLSRVRRLIEPERAAAPKWSGGFAMTVALTVLLVAIGAAQSGVQTGRGSVSGIVRDATGRVIPGAGVIVSSPAVPERSTISNTRGEFVVADLPAGGYQLTASLSGFRTARISGVQITSNQVTSVDVDLEVGSLVEMLTVVGPASAATGGALPPRPGTTIAGPRVAPMAPSALPAPPQGVIVVGGSIRAPKLLQRVMPVYPGMALAAGIQGIVILEGIVATDGTVRNVTLLRSIPELDDAARAAVEQWQFTPTLLNKVPVEIVMTVTVQFEIR